MDIIIHFFITPLKAIYELLFSLSCSVTHGYGTAIILLSLITSVLIIPLERISQKYVFIEKKIQSILEFQISDIKKKYKGIEKNNALSRLYNRYAYSPLYAVRLSFGFLIQLPLLIGAYLFLESYDEIHKVSFFVFNDLSKPDGLLFGINVMPFIMTAVNIVSSLFTPDFTKKEKFQSYAIAFVFLIVLYNASSALLIYWTFNNLFSLIKVTLKKYNLSVFKIIILMKERFINNLHKEFCCDRWKILLYLSSIVPACTLWFNNIEFFGIEAISKSVFILLTISFILVTILSKIKSLLSYDFLKTTFIIAVLVVAIILFYNCSLQQFPYKKKLFVMVSLLFVFFFITGKFKLLNVLLEIQLIIVIISSVVAHSVSEYNSEQNYKANQIDTSVHLKHTPNIYYILCESMNSLDIANKDYGVSQQEIYEFKKYMVDKGFYVPEYMYSNGPATLATLETLSLMTLKGVPQNTIGNFDLPITGRDVIAGNKYNNLLKILKFNGYHVSHLLNEESYFYKRKGFLVDYSSIHGGYDENTDPLMYLNFPFAKIEKKLVKKILKSPKKIFQDSMDEFRWYMEHKFSEPSFVLHRLSFTNHTPPDGSYTYKDFKKVEYINEYQRMYKDELKAIKIETELILSNDPNAIIIFLGDHGNWRYRASFDNRSQLLSILNELDIDEQTFWDDKFKVFAAIRIPENIKQIDGNFSSVNIFSKIFNNIGTEDGRMFEEESNDSVFWGKRIYRDFKFVGYYDD